MKRSNRLATRTGIAMLLVATALCVVTPSAFAVRPLGIDVSAWQGYRTQANWNSAYADGRVFAMIRITHYYVPGVESDSHGDPDWYYTSNFAFARNAGFLCGGYHYARPTVRTPAVEAEYFLNYARPYITSGYLRPALDMEGETTPVVGASSLSDWANQWLNYVHRQTGVKPLVYCNYNWAHNYLTQIDTSFPLWFARWSCPADVQTDVPRLDNGSIASTSPWSTWTFWQYCGGPVAGFSGNIDLDVFNGTYEQLRNHVIGTGITNVQATNVTASTATITWTTDAVSSSQVQYGPTTSYGSLTPLDPNNVTSHSVTLSGLTFNTLYHYRVISANPSWPSATTSADFTFTTTNCSLLITQHPQAQNPCSGTTAVFSVAATGPGTLTYQWQKDGENLADNGRITGSATPMLSIAAVTSADAGNYRCVVTASCGSAPSNPAVLSVRPLTTITQSPQSQSVCPGGTIAFSVAAAGDGTLAYQWQKYNGSVWNNLTNGGRITGATAATMVLSGVLAEDVGDYRCVVTGGCDSAASNPVTLSLKTATTVGDPPQSLTVDARSTATFSVDATGEGAVAYQWQKSNGSAWYNLSDGGRIAGAATDTLVISNVAKSDAGDYRCMVTAGCGSAASATTTLTVNVPLAIATDLDADGDVDLSDFNFFQMCFRGPNQPRLYTECDGADFDRDADVDLTDFTLFQSCFNGPNRPPKC